MIEINADRPLSSFIFLLPFWDSKWKTFKTGRTIDDYSIIGITKQPELLGYHRGCHCPDCVYELNRIEPHDKCAAL